MRILFPKFEFFYFGLKRDVEILYKHVFNGIEKRHKSSTIEVYAEQFKRITKEDYKNFLTEMYVNQNMTKFNIAELLGVTEGVIQRHISQYGIKKSNKSMQSNNVMFKTPSIIEKETGRKFIDIYNELAAQGLSLTEITMKLNIRLVSTVSTYLTNYRRKQEMLLNPPNEDDFIIKGLKGANFSTVERMFRSQLNMEYKDFLEQRYLNEGMSQHEISKILGISEDAISDAVKRYGLKKTSSQARREAINRGTINYDRILSKSRKTRSKSKALSHKQDLLITLIKYKLEQIYNEMDNIEIILGYNEYCILGSLEIDIPIIVIKENQLYKIALEYDGDVWHEDRELISEQKEKLLEQKGWRLIRIEETSSESSNFGLLEDKSNDIVEQIRELIMESYI